MNFFEHQERARKNTKKLVALFLLSVVIIASSTSLLFMYSSEKIWKDNKPKSEISNQLPKNKESLSQIRSFNNFNWILFFKIAAVIIFLIIISSIYKKKKLSIGGKMIAIELSGKIITQDTKVPKEKQLFNIVEEMAIASGITPPPVYVINEEGINAFAAGFEIDDAIIGVTNVAIEVLDRDELQGVIAHEFSHIFNGDMKMNMRLISTLHGILVLGMLGRGLINGMKLKLKSPESAAAKTVSSFNFFIAGSGLVAIGYIGTFFGSLIKAAISRQREFLADSSAVQFTRSTSGISSALQKIGSFNGGSRMSHKNSFEIGHMLFAQGFSNDFGPLISTHPPLSDRISVIDPNWNGKFSKKIEYLRKLCRAESEYLSNRKKRIDFENKKKLKNISMASMAGAAMIQNIGSISQESISNAHDIISQIPKIIKDETSNPFGARAVIYSLLMFKNDNLRQKQLQILSDNADKEVFRLTEKLHEEIGQMDRKFHLPLIDLSIAALRKLSPFQYYTFKKNIISLIKVDSKINIFEWSLKRILFNKLDRELDENYIEKKPIYGIKMVKNEAELLLSLIAHNGNKNPDEARRAFNEARLIHHCLLNFSLIKKEDIKISKLDKAILKLEQLYTWEKQLFIRACIMCIAENGIIFSELEVLRAFCSILNCPMPMGVIDSYGYAFSSSF